ncbi:hypothetical protein PVAND_004686 [Polypedilum vanderplanki]|uniref:Uncharacterized protein n=1 Tax=Polypedilum vanderplanki TaxID=319348 RepID=A0A9J6BXY7_POLVA|nr:hypothetical protein PVAND_004686 [Polypedilum vanderplanki]
MQQTNVMTTVINQEQSDLVTSATLSASGGVQKDSIKNGKTVIITNGGNKNKITTIISNKSNSSSNNNSNNNNNNTTTTNKNSNNTKAQVPNGRSDVIVTNLQHKTAAVNVASTDVGKNVTTNATNAALPDARQVLKEAVDAVVNSFTKHTQGYGRGE